MLVESVIAFLGRGVQPFSEKYFDKNFIFNFLIFTFYFNFLMIIFKLYFYIILFYY